MAVELKIPEVGESITEVRIGRWLVSEGDRVEEDQDVVEVETDKASVELPAPVAGVIAEIIVEEGRTAAVGDVIGTIEEAAAEEATPVESAGEAPTREAGGPAAEEPTEAEEGVGTEETTEAEEKIEADATTEPAEEPVGAPEPPEETEEAPEAGGEVADGGEEPRPGEERRPAEGRTGDEGERRSERASTEARVMPAARRLLHEHDLRPDQVEGTGPGGRVLKEDVERHLEGRSEEAAVAEGVERREEAVPMSLLRRRIGERLVRAQQEAALLTTFNEVDVSAIQRLRQRFRERFREEHGVDLGIMSFFVKATVDALGRHPRLNAEVREDEIVYRNYFDIGIAVGGGEGLVVPVLRDAGRMSFAEIEIAIDDFAERARENELDPGDLQGGTFTISNGGIYGSLLSTPIVNPPQSGILGMHAIEERPVVRDGEVVVRPMMYLALTYDHRIVDGREAVTFLRRIVEAVEDPARMLVEV